MNKMDIVDLYARAVRRLLASDFNGIPGRDYLVMWLQSESAAFDNMGTWLPLRYPDELPSLQFAKAVLAVPEEGG